MDNMNKNPDISVLMACFNASEWLEDAIISVLSQTFINFEFIIVDDGSTDNTLKIIDKFCNIDNRIILIANKHSGLAFSLNIGIKAAKGKWIARIDADDICKPNRLERQFNFVKNRDKVVFVGSNCIEANENLDHQVTTRYPKSDKFLARYLQTARKFPPHSSAFFLKSSALCVDGYRSRFDLVQDRDLWLRMSEVGEMSCIDEALVIIRHHNDNMSNGPSYMPQRAFSYMAMVSYFIRKMRFIDPLEGSELDFIEFIIVSATTFCPIKSSNF